MNPTSEELNAILGALMRLNAPEPVDPYHDCEEHHQLTLEGAIDRVQGLMAAHPQMVAGVRMALTEVLDTAQEMAQSNWCRDRDVTQFFEDLYAIGHDVQGVFAREADDLRRAQARDATLAQRTATPSLRSRRRS